MRFIGVLAFLVAHAGGAVSDPKGSVPSGEVRMTPAPELVVAHGPSTASGDLVAWLARQLDDDGEPALVQLPVLVTLADPPSTVRGGVVMDAPTLALSLDDSALGISLADRARHACPGETRCPLWLSGRLRTGEAARALVVVRVGTRVTDAELRDARVVVAGARPELGAHVETLGRDVPIGAKRVAARALASAGVDAIPLLIASRDDARPYATRDATQRMNLPVGADPPANLVVTPVGAVCEDLLYEIVTPAAASTDPPFRGKVLSEQVLRVRDWRAFWRARRGRSLEQIHKELAPLVRAFWASHGVTQDVP